MINIIEGAEQLINHGLPHSALSLLNSSNKSNFELNSRRQKAIDLANNLKMMAGVYAMVAADSNIGLVVPVKSILGNPNLKDEKFGSLQDWALDSREVYTCAYDWCIKRLALSNGGLPSLVPSTPESVFVEGNSIGLASVLSILEKIAGLEVKVPVIATGAIDESGRVLSVGYLPQKLQAAKDELGLVDGIVLVPSGAKKEAPDCLKVVEVATIDDAIAAVWGDTTLEVDPQLLDFNQLLEKLRDVNNHREAASILRGVSEDSLPPVDCAILQYELGIRLRHTGDIAGAREAHTKAGEILTRSVLECLPERVAAETIEVEILRSEMAGNSSKLMLESIVNRLKQGVSSAHNRVRLRGMLAELKSTLGLHDGVLELREMNLQDQVNSFSMKKEIPWTLCMATWESARVGNKEMFFKYVNRLLAETGSNDQNQRNFNDAAICKGLVVLGLFEELNDWLRGKASKLCEPAGVQLQQLVKGCGAIIEHPQVSTARALVRMYRKTGQVEKAVELADRIAVDATEHMMKWLSLATQFEKALALVQLGRNDDAAELLENVVSIYLRELKNITDNNPSFKGITEEDANNIDARYWEPKLDGIYH